ncbi:MAG TPA: NUDIX domain-containing protein [Planctomycetota bacterium]|nr:NUDIX domain-containing protein [Planctomycetota bacterium]
MTVPLHFEPRYCAACGEPLGEKDPKIGGWPCMGCGTPTWVDPKLAACCVPWWEGKLVLVKRAIEPRIGFYSSPGGYCDRGEPPHAAAARECFEETGLVVDTGELLGVYGHRASPVIVVYYDCEIVGGGPPRALSEVSEIGLFRPEDVPWDRLAFTSVHEALCAAIAHRGSGA